MERPAIAIVQLVQLPSTMANAIQILHTAQALARGGHLTDLFVRARPGVDVAAEIEQTSGRPPADGLSIHVFSARHKGMCGFMYRRRLERLMGPGRAYYARQRQQTIVLLRYRSIAQRLGRAAPIVYEFHNLEHVVCRERGDERGARRARAEEARIVREVERVTAISEPLARDVEAFARELGVSLPGGSVEVVPDGVDLSAFDGVARRPAADPAREEIRLVYAGSLQAHKGVEALVDAVATLPERFRLRIVGGNPPDALEDLRARVQADPALSGRVELAGLVPPNAVPAELARADLVVLPSAADPRAARYTSPLKLFEAMATGAPIVATAVPSIESVLTDGRTAFLAASPEPSDLAHAIERAAADPDRAWSVAEAARTEAARYSWDRRAEAIAEIVRQSAAGRVSPAA